MSKGSGSKLIGACLALMVFATLPVHAQETVSVGGTSVVLLQPKAPRASVILMPGGIGAVVYFLLRQPVLSRCPHCNTEISSSCNFCPQCQFQMAPVCGRCYRGVQITDVYCKRCGHDLAEDHARPAVAVERLDDIDREVAALPRVRSRIPLSLRASILVISSQLTQFGSYFDRRLQ